MVSLLREYARQEKISVFSSLLARIRACSFNIFCLIFHPARLLNPAQNTAQKVSYLLGIVISKRLLECIEFVKTFDGRWYHSQHIYYT